MEEEDYQKRDLGLVYSTASRCIILFSHSGLWPDTHTLLTNMHSFPKKTERIAQWRRVLSSSILSFFCFFSFSLFPVLLCFTFVSSSLQPPFAREEPVLCEPVFLLTRWILSRLSWFYLLFFVFSSWHSRTPVETLYICFAFFRCECCYVFWFVSQMNYSRYFHFSVYFPISCKWSFFTFLENPNSLF